MNVRTCLGDRFPGPHTLRGLLRIIPDTAAPLRIPDRGPQPTKCDAYPVESINWIVDNFGFLEEEDLHTFDHIEESLKNGAMIYFAVENDNVLATCMSKPMDNDGTWELCKLGSNKHLPHKGAGSAVFKAAMDWAVRQGARKLFILSNSRLKAAVHIYEKYGFHEVKLDDYEYVRGDIAFEYQVHHCINS